MAETRYSVAERNVRCGWCPTTATHIARLVRSVRRGSRRTPAGTAWPACDTHAAALRRDPDWNVPHVPAATS